MTMQEVIENELKCVQRDCCRLENECAKCDLVLPKEEIINAYNKALKLEKENEELKERIKTLTIHDTNAVLNGLEMKVLKDSHRDRANKTQEQLTKAKDHIKKLLDCLKQDTNDPQTNYYVCQYMDKAEQFLKECENER